MGWLRMPSHVRRAATPSIAHNVEECALDERTTECGGLDEAGIRTRRRLELAYGRLGVELSALAPALTLPLALTLMTYSPWLVVGLCRSPWVPLVECALLAPAALLEDSGWLPFASRSSRSFRYIIMAFPITIITQRSARCHFHFPGGTQ